MGLESQDAEHRRVASSADGHCLIGTQSLRQRYEPVPLHASPLGVAAEMGFAETPSVEDDAVAGLVVRMARGLDDAGEIDAWDHGKTAHHRRLTGDGQSVLVIDRRVADTNGNVTIHQIAVAQVL